MTFSVYVHICRDFKLKRFHQYFTNHLKFWIDDRIKLFDDGMWKAVKQAEVSEDAASHMKNLRYHFPTCYMPIL